MGSRGEQRHSPTGGRHGTPPRVGNRHGTPPRVGDRHGTPPRVREEEGEEEEEGEDVHGGGHVGANDEFLLLHVNPVDTLHSRIDQG